MSNRSNRHRPVRRRRYAGLTLVVSLALAILATVGSSPSAAYDKGLRLGDNVSFDDGSAAAGIKIDLFEAVNPWTRGDWLGSTRTNRDGHYSFDVGAGCYITVAIAPLGTEFDFLGSGKAYDQIYGCVEGGPNNDFDSVLYREDTKPPPTTTTRPPTTTTPPTTAPPTTTPPTTAPPTTEPPPGPPPHFGECRVTILNRTLSVELSGTRNLPGDTEVIFLSEDGVELERRLLSDAWDRSWDRFQPYPHFFGEREYSGNVSNKSIRLVSLQGPKTKPSDPKTCEFRRWSPIGLDLDGSNAVERISGEFSFDFDADGETESVSEWFAPTEGILFDARIGGPATGEHLFGDQGGLYADGFEKLARLDADGDGWVEGSELDGLAIWTDANSNAELDPGEHSTLVSHGVEALSVSHESYVSEARLADGSTMMTEDLWFPATSPVGTVDTVRVAALGGAGIAILGYATVAARRRRASLDGELADLLAANRRATS